MIFDVRLRLLFNDEQNAEVSDTTEVEQGSFRW